MRNERVSRERLRFHEWQSMLFDCEFDCRGPALQFNSAGTVWAETSPAMRR
jgi:hypothetical protein